MCVAHRTLSRQRTEKLTQPAAHPPPDSTVRDFLAAAQPPQIRKFIVALCDGVSALDHDVLTPSAFATWLGKGNADDLTTTNREALYSKAVTQALSNTSPKPDSPGGINAKEATSIQDANEAIRRLVTKLAPGSASMAATAPAGSSALPASPLDGTTKIVMVFDEAHTVKDLAHLMSVFEDIKTCSICAVFLSTMSQLGFLARGAEMMSSERYGVNASDLLKPVTEMPCDCFVGQNWPSGPPESWTLAEIRTLECVASFGRPLCTLFAS